MTHTKLISVSLFTISLALLLVFSFSSITKIKIDDKTYISPPQFSDQKLVNNRYEVYTGYPATLKALILNRSAISPPPALLGMVFDRQSNKAIGLYITDVSIEPHKAKLEQNIVSWTMYESQYSVNRDTIDWEHVDTPETEVENLILLLEEF